jgi:sugar lactone lactonase YvrE
MAGPRAASDVVERHARLLDAARARCGEGPLWSASTDTLIWLDIPRGRIHRYRLADGPARPIEVGQPVGCLVHRREGGFVMGLRDGFAVSDEIDAPPRVVAPLEHLARGMQLNDGACDPEGRFWAGSSSPTADEPWLGRLYRLGRDLRAEVVLEHVGMSNGIGWSPDGGTMYYVDSRRQSLDAYRFDRETGALSEHRVHFAVPRERGIPDGLAVDAEGAVWLALYGSGTVVRITSDGQEDDQITIAAAQATSCAFGGPDLRTLFITSASEGFAPGDFDAQPGAGALFACEIEIAGLPATPYSDTVASAATEQEDLDRG